VTRFTAYKTGEAGQSFQKGTRGEEKITPAVPLFSPSTRGGVELVTGNSRAHAVSFNKHALEHRARCQGSSHAQNREKAPFLQTLCSSQEKQTILSNKYNLSPVVVCVTMETSRKGM
jgi:hypothetical protein